LRGYPHACERIKRFSGSVVIRVKTSMGHLEEVLAAVADA